MGRTYWFECSRCGYRDKVSGRCDRGLDFFTETVACRECKKLYDVVTKIRVPEVSTTARNVGDQWRQRILTNPARYPSIPPTFEAALNRLPAKGVRRFRWLSFAAQCPVFPYHRVLAWTVPGKCPKCGTYMDKTALPYRIWE